MKKLITIIAITLTTSSCAVFNLFLGGEYKEPFYSCPNVVIPRDGAYLTQVNRGFDDFHIQIVGFEGYCYMDKKIKTQKAVITPIFVVSKLAQTKDSDLDFKFYIQTQDGPPEYIGKWTHLQSAHITPAQKKIKFKGKEVEVRIPTIEPEKFVIDLGLVQTKDEIKFNKQTFDIEYDYIEE